MRIAIFTETYLPYINGVVTHIKILKEGLEKMGHKVLIVTADPHTYHHYLKDNILHCPSRELKKIYGFGLASPLSRKRLRYIEDFDPDIIHIHQEFGIGLFGLMAARSLKKPLVYTLHTMYDEYLYYVAPRPLIPMFKRMSHRYFRLFAKRAQALTGPSEKCAEYFKSVGIDKIVNVIPNSVELDAFNPDLVSKEQKSAFRSRYGIGEDKTIACFVGRIGHEKSVDVLLDYWAKTITPKDNLHLLIIGDGPVLSDLIEQAKSLGIDSMITFTGKVEHEKLPTYYAACDVYITASTSDTNSISMLEGMATGLPVLQIYDRLNENQVRHGVNGFVFSTPEEMAYELRRVRDLSPEELGILKKSVIQSVKKSGAADLANYMLTVYHKSYENA